jgi:hypothetical protein
VDTNSDLEQLLDEAMREARLKRPRSKQKDETHLDYAKRLAEKGLYRRLSREAHMALDALRFEYWFNGEGSSGLTIDQWRVLIDSKMENRL